MKTFFLSTFFVAILLLFAVPADASTGPIKRPGYMHFEMWEQLTTSTTTLPYVALGVVDYDTMQPLHFFREDRVMPTASLMKLVTAGTILKNTHLNWADLLSFSWWDNEGDLRKYVGAKDKYVLLQLEPGEQVSVRDMFASMLIVSANNAANRLATYTAGTVKLFAEQMRQTAREWGMTQTTIEEPSGLSLNNTSTAHDLSLAICNALRNPNIAEFADRPFYTFHLSSGREKTLLHTVHEIRNHPERYLGGKTGFLYETRFHVAAGVTTAAGHRLCIAVLHSPTRAESERILQQVATWADLMYRWQ